MELREEARVGLLSVNTELDMAARKWSAELGISFEEAHGRVLRADPSLRDRYYRYRDSKAYVQHFSSDTAEAETQKIVDAMHDDRKSTLHKKIDALATEYGITHGITDKEAWPHVLRQNPDLQLQWAGECQSGVSADAA